MRAANPIYIPRNHKVEAALGAPWPGQVQVNEAPPAGRPNRFLPVGLAIVGVAGASAALGLRPRRRAS